MLLKEGATPSAEAYQKGFPRGPKIFKVKRSSQGKEKRSPHRDLSRTKGVDVRKGAVCLGTIYLPFCSVLASIIYNNKHSCGYMRQVFPTALCSLAQNIVPHLFYLSRVHKEHER